MKKTKDLIEELNSFLEHTIYKFDNCGDEGYHFIRQSDNKYVQLIIKSDKGPAYKDWYFQDFNETELKKFVDSIPHKKIDDINIRNEYFEIRNLLMKYFNMKRKSKLERILIEK